MSWPMEADWGSHDSVRKRSPSSRPQAMVLALPRGTPGGNGAKLHGDRSAPISALVYRIALDVSVSVVACRASSAASALLVQ